MGRHHDCPLAAITVTDRRCSMMTVMIGIDPHKRSHTAVAIDARGRTLDQLRVAADRRQVAQLLAWRPGSSSAAGRWRAPAGSAARSRSGWCRRVRTWSTFPPRRRRGSARWAAPRTRPTSTTPGRPHSRAATGPIRGRSGRRRHLAIVGDPHRFASAGGSRNPAGVRASAGTRQHVLARCCGTDAGRWGYRVSSHPGAMR